VKTELELVEYRTSTEALRELSSYIRYYNAERLHSSLDTSPQLSLKQSPRKIRHWTVQENLKHPIRLPHAPHSTDT